MRSEKTESVELIDSFIDNVWIEKGLSKNTLYAYKQDLNSFSSWLNNGSLKTVDKAKLLDYLAYRLKKGYGSRSTARSLSSLRSFYLFFLNNQKDLYSHTFPMVDKLSPSPILH